MTIMKQITTIAQTPMNDKAAANVIEDHKYLLETVENRCAFAFFAVQYRNQSLYDAMQKYYRALKLKEEQAPKKLQTVKFETNLPNCVRDDAKQHSRRKGGSKRILEELFTEMLLGFSFITIVMYQELQARRDFIHDCWVIAMST